MLDYSLNGFFFFLKNQNQIKIAISSVMKHFLESVFLQRLSSSFLSQMAQKDH